VLGDYLPLQYETTEEDNKNGRHKNAKRNNGRWKMLKSGRCKKEMWTREKTWVSNKKDSNILCLVSNY